MVVVNIVVSVAVLTVAFVMRDLDCPQMNVIVLVSIILALLTVWVLLFGSVV